MSTFVFDAYGTLYDVQYVAAATEKAFPGYGDAITQVWRLKQLEYTWLRSLMGRYKDFWAITREALTYALDSIGVTAGPEIFDGILDLYLDLAPYPEAWEALNGLRREGHDLAILSNGSPMMLDRLVANSGFDTALDKVISVDRKRAFKPDPDTYRLVWEEMGVATEDVVFVSCNPFDVCGAKSYGFRVAWIERVPATSLHAEVRAEPRLGPGTLFKLLRMRMDALDLDPDWRIHELTELVGLEPTGHGDTHGARST